MKNQQTAQMLKTTIRDYGWAPDKSNGMPDQDMVGIEIELEGIPRNGLNINRIPGWVQVEDGSLRGGVEFVSEGPRTMKQIPTDLEAINTAFQAASFTPVFSFRTSLHVHVNVMDLTHMQLLNMFTLYTIYEQPLLELGGEERIGNVHCMPIFLASGPVDELRRGLKDGDLRTAIQRLARNDLRYGSFNWASLAKFGTIEFRSHRGTSDPKVIERWCQILIDLKRAAKTFDNPQHVIQQFSAVGLDLFPGVIFTNEAFQQMCRMNPTKIWEGVRQAQFMAFAPESWDVTSKSSSKKSKATALAEAALAMERMAWDIPVGGPIPEARVGVRANGRVFRQDFDLWANGPIVDQAERFVRFGAPPLPQNNPAAPPPEIDDERDDF